MSTDDRPRTPKRLTAYQSANWHIVRAGLALATAGVPKDSPELVALRAALRAVNEAGGIEPPKPPPAASVAAHSEVAPRKEVVRVYPPAGGGRFGRSGGAA